jgi:hypothetical protein
MAVKDLDWLGQTTKNLRENLRTTPNSAVERTLYSWVIERIEIAQNILERDGKLRSGSLIPSIRPDIVLKETEAFVKIMAEDYWDYVNSGVDGFYPEGKGKAIDNVFGSKYSFKNLGVSRDMISSLKQWVQKRGITELMGQNIVIAEGVDIENSIAFALAKSIKKKGIESVPYMNEAFGEEAIKDLASRIGKSVNKIMQTPI